MESTRSLVDLDRQNSIEWRLYKDMLVTRLFEEACIRWEHEGKMSAQVFPSRGQEAIAVGACLALEKGDTVIPSLSSCARSCIARSRPEDRGMRRIIARGRSGV
jgi:TPP-dependent pyruvate/acetoin dehydrogenase alpha subunit